MFPIAERYMRRPRTTRGLCPLFLAGVLALSPAAEVAAHGDKDWNDFTIDSKNDQVDQAIEKLKTAVANVILERRAVPEWPDPELQGTKDELLHLQEDLDDMLDHMTEDGIHLQLTSSLRTNPQAGRAVAGSHAIEAGIELLERMAASDGRAAVAEEFHTDGVAALLFDLLSAYADNMHLYEALAQNPE